MHARHWAIAAILLSSPARADDCSVLFDALVGTFQRPFAGTMNTSFPGKPANTSEIILVANKMYIKIKDTWQVSPQSAAEMVDLMKEMQKTAVETCKKDADEAVDGELATVYEAHIVNRGHTSDNKVWVLKRSGNVVKSEVHMAEGGTILQTYRYDNIQAPAGVK